MRKSKTPRVPLIENMSQPKRKRRSAPEQRSNEPHSVNAAKVRPIRTKAASAERSASVSATKNFYLDEQAVAERWDVSVKFVQSLRYKGNGPLFTAFGRNVRYHIRELKAYEKANSYLNRAEMAAPGQVSVKRGPGA